MAIRNYNPYDDFGLLFTNGLDYLIANLPATPTMEDVRDKIYAYFETIPDSPDGLGQTLAVSLNSSNEYINGQIVKNLNLRRGDWAIVAAILRGIKQNSVISLDTDYWDAAQELLVQSEINTLSKSAIYVSLAMARAATTYWKTVATTSGSWSTYVNTNEAINYATVPYWVEAAFTGSISGYAQTLTLNVTEPTVLTTQLNRLAPWSALVGALAVNTGLVIYKWPKRPNPIYISKAPVIR
jgi:hypothetical protein